MLELLTRRGAVLEGRGGVSAGGDVACSARRISNAGRPRGAAPLLAFLLLAIVCGAQEPPDFLRLGKNFESVRALSRREGDLLLVLGRDGAVRTLRADGEGAQPSETLLGALQLEEPGASLIDVAEVLGDGGAPEVVVLDARGLFAHEVDAEGVVAADGIRLDPRRASRGARLGLRTRIPRFSPLSRDLDGDGLLEILVPGFDEVQLFSGTPSEEGPPRFRRVARFASRDRVRRSHRDRRLSGRWSSSLEIAGVDPRDWNGDGRRDLEISKDGVHDFYLRREDGSFPEKPDAHLELAKFQGPPAISDGVRPGYVVAGEGRQTLRRRDLDADGIPDAVISHRRRVWVFPSTESGPQFVEPSQVLEAAEDVSALLLLPVDDDDRPDLVVLKVLVPSVGQLIAGTVSGLEVDVSVLGYRGQGECRFGKKPAWRSRIVLDLPSIGTLMSDVDGLIERVERIDDKLRGFVEADLDGDGRADLVQARDDHLWIWRGAGPPNPYAGSAVLSEILLGESERRWDLDAITLWLGKLADGLRIERTGDRPPDLELRLPRAAEALLEAVVPADLDGDGRDALHLVWRYPDPRPGLGIETLTP